MIFLFYLASEIFLIPGYAVASLVAQRRFSLIFYKFFGMVVTMLVAWGVASLFSISATYSFCICFTLLSVIPLLILRKQKKLVPISSKSIRFYLAISLFSLFLYLFLAYIRTFKTDILGTEKLMDVALITTILKQDKLPIENPWLSGFLMNYYYLGHYLLAMLQKLSSVPTHIGYNLAIGLVGVWIFQTIWMLIFRISRHVFWTYLFALTATFGGNYFMFYELYIQKKEFAWFASATRVIPYTINEFPAYSIILGDLHGHYLSLPFFITALYFMLVLWSWVKRKKIVSLARGGLLLGTILGFLYLINSWDVITLAIVGAVLTIGFVMLETKSLAEIKKLLLLAKKYGAIIIGTAIPALAVFLYSRTMFLPPVAGIGINTAFTPLEKYFELFAHFMVAACILVFGMFFVRQYIGKIQIKRKYLVGLTLVIVSVILIVAVEIFYAKDIFHILNPPYNRTNTVFKFYYHAWILFTGGLFSMLIVTMSLLEKHFKSLLLKFGYMNVLLFFSVSMIAYSSIAIGQFLAPKFIGASLDRFFNAQYQDGYKYIDTARDDDREIINVLLQKDYAVILEFSDYESYSYNARISAYTGHTSIQGWPLHNVQWYGGYDSSGLLVHTRKSAKMPIAERVTDIDTMYRSADASTVESLLKKYGVTYVVFGEREKAFAEKAELTNRFAVYDNLCSIIWSKNDSRIYQCK
ncbi:MAG: DUF2298 domain-containing protein [Candidatus Dojkabacteria bacterium]|nr:MAG: DUF2298 domain-containing protein [Candidatus Dojkabacteria bacterium]